MWPELPQQEHFILFGCSHNTYWQYIILIKSELGFLHRSVFLALRWGSGPSHVSWSIPVEWEMIKFWESLEPKRAILHVWPPDTAERAMLNWLLIDKCLIMLFKANWCLYLCHQTSSTSAVLITLTFWTLLISNQLKWGFVGKCSPQGPLTALKRLWFQNQMIRASVPERFEQWITLHTGGYMCKVHVGLVSSYSCAFYATANNDNVKRPPAGICIPYQEEKSQVMIESSVCECLFGYFCGCVYGFLWYVGLPLTKDFPSRLLVIHLSH